MSKMQKVWLWIFIAMFAVPEILWGVVFGITDFNKNFVGNPENHFLLTLIAFIEFCGLLSSFILLFKSKSGWVLNTIKIVIAVLAMRVLYITYLLYATLNF